MGRFDDKVVMITGGARGQGRSHAVAFAREGADIAVCDALEDVSTVPYPLSRQEDLDVTVKEVESMSRKCLARKADVRNTEQMNGFVAETLETFGKIDILLANAGVVALEPVLEIGDDSWQNMLDINLTGAFKTLRAVAPHMVDRGYGRIIVTSSMGGKTGNPNLGHYVASKWGVIGLVKTLALEIANTGVTVNAVCPSDVGTPMVHNDAMYKIFRPDLDAPTREDVEPIFADDNPIKVAWLEPEDISKTMMFIASDDAKYMTGSTVDVGCGWTALMP